jgi:hypothetical protein
VTIILNMKTKSKNEHDRFLVDYLGEKKFLVSGEIGTALSSKFGVTDVYARKIIERAVTKGFIKSSSPITFGKGQYAYFSVHEKLTLDTIKKIAKQYRPPLYRLIESLLLNSGIISYYEAIKITCTPVHRSSSKIDDLADLVELLRSNNYIYMTADLNNFNYIILSSLKESEERLVKEHYSKMFVDSLFVKDVLDWLTKSNLILSADSRYRNKNTPDKGAEHNNVFWDAFGYTKATGFHSYSGSAGTEAEKQTLVALDIVLSREYSQIDLDGFISRVQININSVKTGIRKIIPVIIYKSCPSFLLKKIKALGCLCYDIGSIYGSNIFAILENMSKLQISQNLERYEEFGKTIEETLTAIKNSGQEDQLKAMKGALFEVMIYQVLRHRYPSAEITANYYYSKEMFNEETNKNEKSGFEYDYVIRSSNPKEIVIVELKGYHSEYEIPLGTYQTKNSIKWFFNRTLPFIKERFQADIDFGYKLKAAYITSSKFEKEGIEHLAALNDGNFRAVNLEVFYDRAKLIKLMELNDFVSLIKIIENFY